MTFVGDKGRVEYSVLRIAMSMGSLVLLSVFIAILVVKSKADCEINGLCGCFEDGSAICVEDNSGRLPQFENPEEITMIRILGGASERLISWLRLSLPNLVEM